MLLNSANFGFTRRCLSSNGVGSEPILRKCERCTLTTSHEKICNVSLSTFFPAFDVVLLLCVLLFVYMVKGKGVPIAYELK
jgi:hypothetical protein